MSLTPLIGNSQKPGLAVTSVMGLASPEVGLESTSEVESFTSVLANHCGGSDSREAGDATSGKLIGARVRTETPIVSRILTEAESAAYGQHSAAVLNSEVLVLEQGLASSQERLKGVLGTGRPPIPTGSMGKNRFRTIQQDINVLTDVDSLRPASFEGMLRSEGGANLEGPMIGQDSVLRQTKGEEQKAPGIISESAAWASVWNGTETLRAREQDLSQGGSVSEGQVQQLGSCERALVAEIAIHERTSGNASALHFSVTASQVDFSLGNHTQRAVNLVTQGLESGIGSEKLTIGGSSLLAENPVPGSSVNQQLSKITGQSEKELNNTPASVPPNHVGTAGNVVSSHIGSRGNASPQNRVEPTDGGFNAMRNPHVGAAGQGQTSHGDEIKPLGSETIPEGEERFAEAILGQRLVSEQSKISLRDLRNLAASRNPQELSPRTGMAFSGASSIPSPVMIPDESGRIIGEAKTSSTEIKGALSGLTAQGWARSLASSEAQQHASKAIEGIEIGPDNVNGVVDFVQASDTVELDQDRERSSSARESVNPDDASKASGSARRLSRSKEDSRLELDFEGGEVKESNQRGGGPRNPLLAANSEGAPEDLGLTGIEGQPHQKGGHKTEPKVESNPVVNGEWRMGISADRELLEKPDAVRGTQSHPSKESQLLATQKLEMETLGQGRLQLTVQDTGAQLRIEAREWGNALSGTEAGWQELQKRLGEVGVVLSPLQTATDSGADSRGFLQNSARHETCYENGMSHSDRRQDAPPSKSESSQSVRISEELEESTRQSPKRSTAGREWWA